MYLDIKYGKKGEGENERKRIKCEDLMGNKDAFILNQVKWCQF